MPAVFASLPAGMLSIVIDHESTDDTARIAERHGARVITRPFQDFVQARRFAAAQVETPWTLMIDADERLDEQLERALADAGGNVDAYEIDRDTLYCGRALRVWRGERLLRLFRTGAARLEASPVAGGSAQLHERWTCAGVIAKLPGSLVHDSYPSRAAYDEKFERYTSIEAQGVRPSVRGAIAASAAAPVRFAWYALRRGALLDGLDGLYVAWHSASYSARVRWKSLRLR